MGLLHSLRASQALTPIPDVAVAAGRLPPPVSLKKFDRLQDATDSFLRHLENGECHWQQPDPVQAFAPINGISGRPFYAFNALRLSMRGCNDDPRWCTAKQAKAQGWWIRKGQTGTHLLAWEQAKEDTGRLDADGNTELRKHPMLYAFKVFNFSQLDGPAPYAGTHPTLAEVQEQVLPIAEGMGVTIRETADRAPGYCSAQDVVHVRPPSAYASEGQYSADVLNGLLAVAAREAMPKLSFPSEEAMTDRQRAQVTLRLEMARAMLSLRIGLPLPSPTPVKDAPLVELLQGLKSEVERAARDADRIMRYVLSFNVELVPTLEREHREAMDLDVAAGAPDVIFDANDYDFWPDDRAHSQPNP